MTTKHSGRDPSTYISNNLTVAAWAALTQIQAAARKAGLNPSKSAVLIAARALAETHQDELIALLEDQQ